MCAARPQRRRGAADKEHACGAAWNRRFVGNSILCFCNTAFSGAGSQEGVCVAVCCGVATCRVSPLFGVRLHAHSYMVCMYELVLNTPSAAHKARSSASITHIRNMRQAPRSLCPLPSHVHPMTARTHRVTQQCQTQPHSGPEPRTRQAVIRLQPQPREGVRARGQRARVLPLPALLQAQGVVELVAAAEQPPQLKQHAALRNKGGGGTGGGTGVC